jgi:hypothetical protein
MKLEFWSDTNWGGEEGRESVSGFVGTLAGGAVTYSSKKQASVAVTGRMATCHNLDHIGVAWGMAKPYEPCHE